MMSPSLGGLCRRIKTLNVSSLFAMEPSTYASAAILTQQNSSLTLKLEGLMEHLPKKGTKRDCTLHCQVERLMWEIFYNVSLTWGTMQENQNCESNESFCKGISFYKKARKQPNLLPFQRLFTWAIRLQPGGLHFKWTPKRMYFLNSHPCPWHLINRIIQCPHLSTQQTSFLYV